MKLACTLEELYKGCTKRPAVKATVPADPWGMGVATRWVRNGGVVLYYIYTRASIQ